MSSKPYDASRKIFFGGTDSKGSLGADAPPNSPARTASGGTTPVIPVPPWKKNSSEGVEFARPNPQAGVVVDVGELEARIDRNLTKLRADVAGLNERFAMLNAILPSSKNTALTESASTLNTERARIEAKIAELEGASDERHRAAMASANQDVDRLAAALAPFGAGTGWNADNWEDLAATVTVSDHFRVGGVLHGGQEFPALAPLAPGAGWYIEGDAAAGQALLFSTVLRIVATAPVTNLAIETFDPKMSAALGPLAPLRNIHGGAFPPPQTQSDAFSRRVEAITAQASLNAERVVSGGARSLTELWRGQSSPEGTLNVIAVLDYPYGIDESAQRALVKLAALGPAAGAIVIVQDSGSSPATDRVLQSDLKHELLRVRTDGRTVSAEGFPQHVVATCDDLPSSDVVSTILRAVKDRAQQSVHTVLPLEELLGDEIQAPWQHSAIHALEATIGRSGKEDLELVLGTSTPPHAFALIGGATGTGKSNLLLAIIYSLALKYSPSQLGMYLLDFKQGLEFTQFDANPDGTGWLPHVRILSLESDQQFGTAVLEDVVAEIGRRAGLFKDAGDYKSYDQYVAGTGASLERLLIVIDEFQVLFEEQTDATDYAVSLLETIIRQARAFGVHLILASQTTSGIAGLARKGDSIYGQIAVRISLKNNVAESRAILSNDNTAATTLAGRGEVILNRDFGMNPDLSNQRGFVAFVRPDAFRKIQQQLWDRSHGVRPLVFFGRQPAQWDLEELRRLQPGRETLDLWVGRPITTDRSPATVSLAREVDQTIAILGPDRERNPVLPGLITSMIVSAAHLLGPGDEIVVLNGYGDSAPDWLYPAIDHVERCGLGIRVVAARAAAGVLRDELALRTRDSAGRVFVVSLATQRIPDLDVESGVDDTAAPLAPDGADSDGGLLRMNLPAGERNRMSADPTVRSGRQALQLLATEGGLRGVNLVAAWNNVNGIKADLGFDHAGVHTYLTVGLGGEDLKAVTGEYQPRVPGWPRVGVVDRNSSAGVWAVVPFSTWDRELQQRAEAAE